MTLVLKQLPEHLHARHRRLAADRLDPQNLDLVADLDHVPRSMRPVTTVPRPLIENTSSTAIRNGLSMSRSGVRHVLVHRVHQLHHRLHPLVFTVECAERPSPAPPGCCPRRSRTSSRSSRTSISTNSRRSGSSTASTLVHEAPRCTEHRPVDPEARAPWSAASGRPLALTTRIAPSICAAPVIMFFT